MSSVPIEGVAKSKQPVLVFQFFPFPQTKKIALQTIFRTDDPISKENLAKTSTVRDELYTALISNNSTAIMTASERYLPLLFGFVVAVEDNKKLRLNSPLNFSWGSAIYSKTKQFVCYTYKYEAIMGCLVYAYANMNRAFETLSSASEADFEEPSKKAATYLRTAAGIFDYVNTRELPRWTDIPKERPMEITSQILQALTEYCCAAAQMITIKKALLGNQTSRITMAKLAVDVWKKMESANSAFKSHADVKEMNPALRTFLNICQSLSKAVAFKYLGEDAYRDEKFGVAVSYLGAASSSLQGLEVPQVGSALAKYKNEVEESRDDIEHLKRTYNNENNHIYFQKQIETIALEIPEAKNLMTPIAWMPPQPSYTSLEP